MSCWPVGVTTTIFTNFFFLFFTHNNVIRDTQKTFFFKNEPTHRFCDEIINFSGGVIIDLDRIRSL